MKLFPLTHMNFEIFMADYREEPNLALALAPFSFVVQRFGHTTAHQIPESPAA